MKSSGRAIVAQIGLGIAFCLIAGVLVLRLFAGSGDTESNPPLLAEVPLGTTIALPATDEFKTTIPKSTRILVVAPSCETCAFKRIPWKALDDLHQPYVIVLEKVDAKRSTSTA